MTFVIINALQIAYSFFLFSDKIINSVTCTSTKHENRIIYKKIIFSRKTCTNTNKALRADRARNTDR